MLYRHIQFILIAKISYRVYNNILLLLHFVSNWVIAVKN